MNRLRAALLILALFVMVVASGCKPASDQELHVFTWSDYFSQELIQRFEREHGVRIVFDTYGSNEDLVTKLQAGVIGYDVIVPSDYAVQQLANLRLLEPIDRANIPNWDNIDPNFLGKYFDPANEYSIPYLWGTAGIGYDSSVVETPPTSWAALWDEAYANNINMLDDVRETMGVAFKRLGYSINTVEPAKIAEARDMLMAQKRLVRSYTTETDDLMTSKQVAITHAWSGDVLRVAGALPEWRYVIPEEGSTVFIDNLCIPKGAPHKALAETFLNFVLQPEIIATVSAFTRYGNCVPESQSHLPQELKTNPAMFPSEDVLENLEPIQDVGEALRTYSDAWTAIKSSQ